MLGAYGTTYSIVTLAATLFTSFFGQAIGVVLMLTIAGVLDAGAGLAAWKLLPSSTNTEAEKERVSLPARAQGLAGNTTID